MLLFILMYTIFLSLIMIGFGLIFMKKAPKEINGLYGYRTKMSSKNKETWNFAHQYAGKVWLSSGVVNAIVSFMLIGIFNNTLLFENVMGILLFVQLGVMLLVIPLTERALKKNFDTYGNRR